MRIFWWQAGLHIEPENPEEVEMLRYLQTHIRFGRAPNDESFRLVTAEEITAEEDSLVQAERRMKDRIETLGW